MSEDDFRSLALLLPETEERAHMGHPDFRVAGKIFATLGAPDEKWGMVKLTPTQQRKFVGDHPQVFQPVKGGWGKGGATNVHLKSLTKTIARKALSTAWRNSAPKRLLDEFEKGEEA